MGDHNRLLLFKEILRERKKMAFIKDGRFKKFEDKVFR